MNTLNKLGYRKFGASLVKNLQKNYLDLVDKGKGMVLMIDEHFNISFVSGYIQEILHYTPENVIGKSLFEFISPQNKEHIEAAINHIARGGEESSMLTDILIYCTFCYQHYFDGTITKFGRNSRQKQAHYVLYLHEVTERKQKEEQLRALNLELDSFIYKASHDLRSPLLSLSGLINIAEEEANESVLHYIDLMRQSVQRLDKFIVQLAQYTRNNNLEAQCEQVNLKSLMQEVIEMHRYQMGAENIQFDLDIEIADEVSIDTFRLKIILNNLISNSIKYRQPNHPAPWVRITVRANSQQVTITVADNGIGIKQEYVEKIFEMFSRATDQGQGSGLGLHILKKALKKMDGNIEVESKFGEGSTFRVYLPNHIYDCTKE